MRWEIRTDAGDEWGGADVAEAPRACLPTLPASDGHNVSAMLRRTDKRARPSPTHPPTHASHTRTHARATYNSFMSIFLTAAARIQAAGSGPAAASILRALLPSLRLYLPPLTLYVILPPLSLVSLPVHFLIGAAARRCCCAAERRGRCRAGCKQERSAAPGGRSVGGMRAVVVK